MLAFRQISRVARPVARRMASVSSTSTSRVAPRFAAFLATSGLIIAAGAASEVDFPCNNISFCLADVGGTEPKTGISFPIMVDGFRFLGSGVRVKYGFVKVYAVGAYADPGDVKGVEDVAAKLNSSSVSKSIRIVMNRSLSVEKYMAAIMEALEPRMNGQDLHHLENFKTMNPPGDLKEGSEMIMTIKGDTMVYRSSEGGMGTIKSQVFCDALADVYFGKDPVSPALKTSIAEGAKKL
ncbi:hypothetical protein TrVE_jg14269 [Triparma verrucosa]|uniref:Chalcone isomerase domain-containing protein n=2 Tax=Triparma TaxID=722752 RepID=A0A9W7ELJ0_9STRA|nr:hypothetical protein TrST_g7138 [Triparma strigata]GMH98233.1 hypothetical protein TrVE_jg14269 [Triparma verrucosa]